MEDFVFHLSHFRISISGIIDQHVEENLNEK